MLKPPNLVFCYGCPGRVSRWGDGWGLGGRKNGEGLREEGGGRLRECVKGRTGVVRTGRYTGGREAGRQALMSHTLKKSMGTTNKYLKTSTKQ